MGWNPSLPTDHPDFDTHIAKLRRNVRRNMAILAVCVVASVAALIALAAKGGLWSN